MWAHCAVVMTHVIPCSEFIGLIAFQKLFDFFANHPITSFLCWWHFHARQKAFHKTFLVKWELLRKFQFGINFGSTFTWRCAQLLYAIPSSHWQERLLSFWWITRVIIEADTSSDGWKYINSPKSVGLSVFWALLMLMMFELLQWLDRLSKAKHFSMWWQSIMKRECALVSLVYESLGWMNEAQICRLLLFMEKAA